jgi:hypothetical protein
MPRIRDWEGVVGGRTDDLDGVGLVSPGTDVSNSWAGPFRGLASDNQEYFIKSLQTCPPGHGSSLAVELIVSKLGQLIDAPTCTTTLIRIPEAFDGFEVSEGVHLKPGWAHGSLVIQRAREIRPELRLRNRDDNRARHAGAYALYDWCFGDDPQWLHDMSADMQLFSYDHGLYFPSDTGPKSWTREMLLYHSDDPRLLPDSPVDLSKEACESYANALDAVTRDSIANVLQSVPLSWPVSDEDLNALGWFLEHRAPRVATRIRELPQTANGGS